MAKAMAPSGCSMVGEGVAQISSLQHSQPQCETCRAAGPRVLENSVKPTNRSIAQIRCVCFLQEMSEPVMIPTMPTFNHSS